MYNWYITGSEKVSASGVNRYIYYALSNLIGTTDARVACFFVLTLAIFQLTSEKFQTFAYNSKTVWSSFMKF